MNVVAVIMGGGQGQRLQPLTRDRAKPAVPIAGKYRLVDIPISNCINSGIRKMYILTQFNSVSLHQHIHNTYRFDQFDNGIVRILAAQQTPGSDTWFQGTADAVRQSLSYILEQNADYILILSGDQLYRMDFSDVIHQHLEKRADVTICTKPVVREEAGALGIMNVDEESRIMDFLEKPGNTPKLDPYRAPMFDEERYLASMGIYLFNREILEKALDNDSSDFGKSIIPASIKDFNVFSYNFEGYWKDIGTIRSFWEENLALTDVVPEFNFYDPNAPIYTRMRFLPPSKINGAEIDRCLVSEGCIIAGKRVYRSIIGIRARVGEGSVVENTVMMGADHHTKQRHVDGGLPPVGIGKDCIVKNAIVDKNARIGDGCVITPEGKDDVTTDLYTVKDGVITIPKNAVIPSGTKV